MLKTTVPPATGAMRPRPRRRFGAVPRSPAFWFLLPAVAALAIIGIYPLLLAVYNSFHQYKLADLASGTPFVGLDNYIATLSDPSFWGALGRTVLFLCVTLPIEIAFGPLRDGGGASGCDLRPSHPAHALPAASCCG